MDYFYRNGDGDEMLFVHYGTGKIETMFGTVHYRKGDYVTIPIGTIYRVIPDEGETKFLVVEQIVKLQHRVAIVMNMDNC